MLERITRFYLSRKTFSIAIVATLLTELLGMVMELTLNDLIPFELIAYGILFLLLIGLCITYHKQDHILMNGIVSGILIYEFVRYVYLLSYVANDALLSYYSSEGLFGCFCFSFVFLSVAVVFLITYNHFTINRSRAVNRTKIVLNQFLLFLSFFTPIAIIAMSCLLAYSVYEIGAYAAVYFSDALVLLVVACCELQLAMNRTDGTAMEELIPSDVKAALWYAFSFLFGLLCLSMSILVSNTKPFVYVLSNTDLLLSLALLIYYLNRKKEPSPGFRICLCAGFVTTVGLMFFSIGYFVWTILS